LRVFVGREEARALPPLVEIGFDGGRPEVLLREIERRLRRSFVSRHQLLTPSRKQKRRLVQGRAASWYHPGFARKRSPCLIPLYRADPIRLAGDLPNLSRGTLFTRQAPSLSVRGSYSSRSRPVTEQDNEDREKNDSRGESHKRRGPLRRRGRQGRSAVRRQGRGLVARHCRGDRGRGRSRARRIRPAEVIRRSERQTDRGGNDGQGEADAE